MQRTHFENSPKTDNLTNRIDLKSFLEAAGITELKLKDSQTRAMVEEFIQKHKVVDVLKYKKTTKAPMAPTSAD